MMKCRKYISHLNKVLPATIEVQGEATGFLYKHSIIIMCVHCCFFMWIFHIMCTLFGVVDIAYVFLNVDIPYHC